VSTAPPSKFAPRKPTDPEEKENNPVREEVALPPPKVEAGMTIEEWMEVKRKIATAAEELS